MSVLATRLKAYEEAFNSRDIDTLLNIYSNDAKAYLPANNSIVEGHDGLRTISRSLVSDFTDFKQTSEETQAVGEYICEIGRFSCKDREKQINGRYMTLWKNEGGTWKKFRECSGGNVENG